MSYEASHEHHQTGPQPIIGLARACSDRVQSGMNMRGLAGPGREKLNGEVLRGRTTRCRYTFTAINAWMTPHPLAGGCALGTQLNFIAACAKRLRHRYSFNVRGRQRRGAHALARSKIKLGCLSKSWEKVCATRCGHDGRLSIPLDPFFRQNKLFNFNSTDH